VLKDKAEAQKRIAEQAGKIAGVMREKAVAAFRAKYGPLDGATVALLPGWRAESIYRETCQQTAVTYFSPENSAYGTVKSVEAMFGFMVLEGKELKAIDEARANVQDPKEAGLAYAKVLKDKAEAQKRIAEQAGKIAGVMREKAVAAFRAKYGPLDGATVALLPGWRAESIYRETCQQTAVTYFSPENSAYGTVKSVEAMFGFMVLEGKELKAIDEARANVQVDEKGKAINAARVTATYTRDLTGELTEGDATKASPSKRARLAMSGDYAPSDLRVLPARGDNQAQAALTSAAEVHGLLVARGFREGTELLCVRGVAPGHRLAGALEGALFYELPEKFLGRPCYQKIARSGAGALCCGGLYICWSDVAKRWKLGSLCETKAGIAYSEDDQPTPTSVSQEWQIFNAAS